MDKFITHSYYKSIWYMYFANDIILIGDNLNGINYKLE